MYNAMFVAVVVTLVPVTASLLAAAVPARRAATISPAVALRVTG